MNLILSSPAIDILDNVFIFYNFKQVRDAIMIVTFVEEAGSWQKTFIYYSNENWQTENLKNYFDHKKYNWVCRKLQPVFQHYENFKKFNGINIDYEKQGEPGFVLGLYKVS